MPIAKVSMSIPSECQTPHELTSHQMVGLVFITENAYLSITAATFIFLLILYNLRRHKYRPRSIFQSPIDIYIFSLIISDLFQGLGSALIVRWIQLGHVYCGKFCTVQGTFQILGETSSAMNTLVIAIHTFWVIALRRPPIAKGLWVPLLVVTLIWSYVVIFIVIFASERVSWNVPDPYWCWIGHQHLAAQLAGEYLWLWITALASIVLYVPLFFILKGWIGGRRDRGNESTKQLEETTYRDPNPKEKFKSGGERSLEQTHVHHTDIAVVMFHKDGASHTTMPTMDSHPTSSLHGPSPPAHPLSDTENASGHPDPSSSSVPIVPPTSRPSFDPRHSLSPSIIEESPEPDSNIPIPTRYGLRFLLYPIAYTVLVLPLSVARWSSGFSTTITNHSGDRTTLTATAIYSLSGFVNAFLVLFTRRSVSLLSPPQKEDKDEENAIRTVEVRGRVDLPD